MKNVTELPELPGSWEWQGGNGNGNEWYDTFFGTTYHMGGPYAGEYGLGGFSGQIFTDSGYDGHVVEIASVTRMEGDDPIYGYAEIYEEFETKEEAHNAIPELIEEL